METPNLTPEEQERYKALTPDLQEVIAERVELWLSTIVEDAWKYKQAKYNNPNL